ncbi:hypothetical protein D3P08_02710 [Paenibacillus nanensis]|uniref:N-acetyltransferase domain-containing protein n=1 Tax=Paenibacillus nanensis TaxID=393251 RepID=A0A3A1VJ20_9BACL|nr:hypothetical protein [Paenibacillus nanensis]RIX60487.1 hypothetical protein D3P08_02710 [Paenibacillus nanensis]
MFKPVENELELAMFNGIWSTVWREKGYELEFEDRVLDRFIIMTEEGHGVGTSEIKPYDGKSAINKVAPFHQHPKVVEAGGAVAEIDKIALLRSYRGKGSLLSSILSSAVYCAEKRTLRYFVSLLEPIFLRALKITFKVPLERVGEKVFYKGDDVVPVLFHMEEMYRNKQRYDWLSYPTTILEREKVNAR